MGSHNHRAPRRDDGADALSDHTASGRRAAKPSGRHIPKSSSQRAAEPYDRRAAKPSGRHIPKSSSQRAAEPSGRRAAKPSGRRTPRSASRRAAEPAECRERTPPEAAGIRAGRGGVRT